MKKNNSGSISNQFNRVFSFIVKDDKVRTKVQYNITYIVLSLVAVVMTVLNIFTHKGALTVATGVFAALCVANVLLHNRGGVCEKIAKYTFMVELLALFTFFLVSGNPEGFSSIWITLLPPCALLLYQLKEGSLLSLAMLVIMVFLLQTGTGRSFLQYNYTESFCMRFPILYVADFTLAFLLEVIRKKTFDNYQFLIAHDPLTGAFNRRGFFEFIEKELKESKNNKVSFLIMDLDLFKNVNDTYGHDAGDAVLQASVERIAELTGLPVCRWGGEEFAVFDKNGEFDALKSEKLCKDFGELVVEYEGNRIPVHISIGVVSAFTDKMLNIVQLSKEADNCLYEAKNTGRGKAVVKEFA